MKIKSILTLIIILNTFQFTLNSCKDDQIEEIDPCSDSITEMDLKCECASDEIFTIVENMPSFGIDESDLSDYIMSSIEISGINQIENGEINLRLVIFDNGKPCLSSVMGNNVPEESLLGFDTLIENMPNWNPGTQREIAEYVFINIEIKIISGEIESIN